MMFSKVQKYVIDEKINSASRELEALMKDIRYTQKNVFMFSTDDVLHFVASEYEPDCLGKDFKCIFDGEHWIVQKYGWEPHQLIVLFLSFDDDFNDSVVATAVDVDLYDDTAYINDFYSVMMKEGMSRIFIPYKHNLSKISLKMIASSMKYLVYELTGCVFE